ncbi:MAG: hypothetical protein K6E47_13225 [Lachnospiraceae bacterium]|nr:hypothetical protein [Lachnospiraceae bacterium]
MKKTNHAPMRAKAVVSIIVILCMLFSLTACNGSSNDQHNAGISTRDDKEIDEVTHGVDEPHQEINSGANFVKPSDEPTSTSEPVVQSGAYSYKLYGKYDVSMDINIDDYIMTNDNGTFFRFDKLAKELGWAGNEDGNSSNAYSRVDGSLETSFGFRYYNEETVTGTDGYQLRGFGFYHGDNSGFECDFGKHYDKCEYRLIGQGWYASHDDVVLLTYVLWLASTNSGADPMISVFGDDVSDYTHSHDGAGNPQYLLP